MKLHVVVSCFSVASNAVAWVVSAPLPIKDNHPSLLKYGEHSIRTPQYMQAMGNLSYMLGWTMAGTAISPELLDWTCRNITSTGHGKWYAEGLVPANIQAPICNLTHSSPNATIASPWLTHYNTELFVTQLLHSFAVQNMADAMTHICNNIRPLPVDAFIMDSNRVANATCAAAGKQVNPAPATPAATPNSTAVSAYTNTASVLYAIMFASSATIDSELNIYCAHAPEYLMNLNDIRLNGTVVESVLCSSTINGLLNVETAKATIKSVSSRLFATAIQGVSDGDGWSGWLCDNLDANAMNAVGLDGLGVRSMICEGWRCGKVFGDSVCSNNNRFTEDLLMSVGNGHG